MSISNLTDFAITRKIQKYLDIMKFNPAFLTCDQVEFGGKFWRKFCDDVGREIA